MAAVTVDHDAHPAFETMPIASHKRYAYDL